MTTTAGLALRRPIEEHLESVESHLAFPIASHDDSDAGNMQQPSPPDSLRPSSPHPLEAHVRQLETYETERPPFYNKSTIAPDLNFSADSLREDARVLAKILISFMAYAIRTYGTTNVCQIGLFGRFEMWPDRPPEANTMPITVLNEKNIIYGKALIYARRDLQDRGLYIRKFVVKDDKRKKATTADWVVDFVPIQRSAQNNQNGARPYVPPSTNELLRLHREQRATPISPRPLRANSVPAAHTQNYAVNPRPRTLTVSDRSSTSGVNPRTNRPGHINEFGHYGNNCKIM